MRPNFKRILADDEPAAADFRDGAEFKAFCVSVVAVVKRLGSATYRDLREALTDERGWLFEAVESCKRAGLIQEGGSALISRFSIGGHEIKPEKTERNNTLAMSVPFVPRPNLGLRRN